MESEVYNPAGPVAPPYTDKTPIVGHTRGADRHVVYLNIFFVVNLIYINLPDREIRGLLSVRVLYRINCLFVKGEVSALEFISLHIFVLKSQGGYLDLFRDVINPTSLII